MNEIPYKLPYVFIQMSLVVYHNTLFRLDIPNLATFAKLKRLRRRVGERDVSVGKGDEEVGVRGTGGSGLSRLGDSWVSSSSGIMRRWVTFSRHSDHSSTG